MKIKIILLVLLQVVIFSCKKNENLKENKKIKKQLIEYTFEFPDTVFVNKEYNGVIKYKSVLDSITTSFDDEKKNRYVLFFLSIVKEKPNYNFDQLKVHVKDTFGAIDNRTIYLKNVKFTEVGEFYIDGIINDLVVIDVNRKNSEGSDLVRLIENEERITRKVIVVKNQ